MNDVLLAIRNKTKTLDESKNTKKSQIYILIILVEFFSIFIKWHNKIFPIF